MKKHPKTHNNLSIIIGCMVIMGQATKEKNPFVAVQIDALLKNTEKGRPHQAPPLKQTIKRLIPILESMKIQQ